MFEALARLAEIRRRGVVAISVICFVIAGVLGSSVIDRMDPYGADDPASESYQAEKALEESGFRPTSVVVLIEGLNPASRPGRERIEAIAREVRAVDGVESVTGFNQTGDPAFVSRQRNATYLAVSLEPVEDKAMQELAVEVDAAVGDAPDVTVGGAAMAEVEINEQVESDLQRAELLAFPILFLLALLFFRSATAALLPMMVGGLSIVGTLFVLRLGTEVGSISLYALNITVGLGLGLAIDYSLFIVSRYREEIALTGPGSAAMRRTLATAGRTVFFSGITVAAALASLLVFPQRFLYSMGIGGMSVALLSALIALTVLPAVLAMLGHRVNSLSPRFLARRADRDARPEERGFWYRLSRLVMSRPVPVATIASVALIVVGLPFLGIKFTGVDAQVLPESASAHVVDDVMRSEFPPHRDTPARIVIEGADRATATSHARELESLEGVSEVGPAMPVGEGIMLLDAYLDAPALGSEARETVREIRDAGAPPGAEVSVAGASAFFIDFQESLVNHLPLAVAIIVVSSLLVLFLMTGSVVLPIKGLVMNALNLVAVFGILVWIFQDGRLEKLLGYSSQGGIEQTMPIVIFATGFGLSTDYAVFLLSRIKEARDAGASESECVAIGLERTGRIVTAAALLFAIAMGAFATSEIIFIKQTGIGIALAVLIDASVVRALLVPSLMELLGRWNWWAPRPLRRLHERLGIGESASV